MLQNEKTFIALIPTLKELFLFHTRVTEAQVLQLKKEFPSITFEVGGYSVPTLTTDTAMIKPPKI